MTVQPPSSGNEPKVVENETRRCVGPVTIIERDKDSPIAEPDDVDVPLVAQVGDVADVVADTPPFCKTKVFQNEGRGSKGFSIVTRDEDTGIAKSYYIAETIACSIANETDMSVNSPAPGDVAKVLYCKFGGMGPEAGAEDGVM
ncbi:hypothetical protein H1R20_g13133, partial [Candolleomyces eurysporus]